MPAIAGALSVDEDYEIEQSALRRARNARRAGIRHTFNALDDVPDLEFQNTDRQ